MTICLPNSEILLSEALLINFSFDILNSSVFIELDPYPKGLNVTDLALNPEACRSLGHMEYMPPLNMHLMKF